MMSTNNNGTARSNNKKQKLNPALLSVLDHKEIWIGHILPFLGMGQYAYIGAVNKEFNHLYKEYCDSVKNPPLVMGNYHTLGRDNPKPVTSTDTLYSVAFYNVACATYWSSTSATLRGQPSLGNVCQAVAKVGSLRVLQWARQKSYPWDERTCRRAAEGGHLELLKWARENGCPWDQITCSSAAGGGHLELLKWAHENGCPWNEWTCLAAARHGHLELLKWARENGAMECGHACRCSTWTFGTFEMGS
ncbi:ankyrin repeat protein [Seminavis robusta]|uniref:Ankyrin repeat protein n=1 Tax=Seminavis robusta TaxID=568900 RepID=A0A9N8HDG8_9STRA|nr:ankyrin repeat protein [Seminavis robusta]|eukprot:Sro360_g126180.1 ankyrin repeat protein (248) ;mRNA; f:6016-6759